MYKLVKSYKWRDWRIVFGHWRRSALLKPGLPIVCPQVPVRSLVSPTLRHIIASAMLRTTANQLWTRVVPAARQAYPAAGVAVSDLTRSQTPVGRVIRLAPRSFLISPLPYLFPVLMSATLTFHASPFPTQTQRTFAAAAAEDDAHAVSEPPSRNRDSNRRRRRTERSSGPPHLSDHLASLPQNSPR